MTRTFQALALLGEAGAESCPSLRACASSRCLSSRHHAPFLLTAAGRRALLICSTRVNEVELRWHLMATDFCRASIYTPSSGSGWPTHFLGEQTSQSEACSHRSCQEVQQSSHCRPIESSRPSEGRGVTPSDITRVVCLYSRLRDTRAS